MYIPGSTCRGGRGRTVIGGRLVIGGGGNVGTVRWRRPADHLPVAVCVVASLVDLFLHDHLQAAPGDALAVLLVLVGGLALTVRVRLPVWALLVSGSCAFAMAVLGYRMPVTLLAPTIALYSTGAAGGRLRSAAVVLATTALGNAGLAMITGGPLISEDLVPHTALVAAPVLVGELVRAQRASVRLLLEQIELEARADQDSQRLQVEQERRRIARDLHDVVGHALTTISVQAGVAAHLLDRQPGYAREALEGISTTGRDALRELRAIVGVLRDPDGERCPAGPEPRIDDVAPLVESAREAGLDATLAVTGGASAGVPAGIQATVYRVVQESLTNARRHAGGVGVAVEIGIDEQEVRVRVRNDGPGTGGDGRPGTGGDGRPGTERRGTGLTGMRERVGLLGGTLRAGPTPGGGFEVLARMPCRPDRSDDVDGGGGGGGR